MKHSACVCLALWAAATAADLVPRQTAAPSTTAASPEITAVTDCHLHGTELFCFAGTEEYRVHSTPTATTDLPAEFTGCHNHGSDLYCLGPDGSDIELESTAEGAHEHEQGSEEDHDHEHEEESGGAHCHFHAGVEHCEEEHTEGGEADADTEGEERHCHFHAGVEHCEEHGASSESSVTCEAPSRDYNVGLRVGLLFVILATSAIGVFAPILLQRIWPKKFSLPLMVLRQFGTGIIISTAFIHLYTHAALMFGNECVRGIEYEGVTAAIVMAGIFLSFLVEYIGHRFMHAKAKRAGEVTATDQSRFSLSTQVTGILVMEAGILFHSILIGLTLVVAGDSFFITLFIVILFHQFFEGIALGSRIADLGTTRIIAHSIPTTGDASNAAQMTDKSAPTADETSASSVTIEEVSYPLAKKLGLAALFAFITPIGMAIGIGVLQQFNGRDQTTLIAIGTLDALSAGILIWVGVVEMWAGDWMTGIHGRPAELADADLVTVVLSLFGLISGLVLMSVLGRWA
ncbi:hypothetical protein B0I35DRAFT_406782 [Stachybotrys elegans]|uniref:Zinc/iron permease n=1 Tax=Stachybotrys elegans TaxID=80388 RepID=A0A8K0SZ10_9HYPO|nr:hypothetical protein B0I35DRAFT_406782 [Stachybotrys elegans]